MKNLAKALFADQPCPGRPYPTFMARNLMKICGEPIDVEWLQQHYASVNTVLVRFKGNWAEAWGEDVKLPVLFEFCTTAQLKKAIAAHFHQPDALVPCPVCGTKTLNRTHFPSKYRDQRCSTCWFADFEKEQAAEAAKEKRKQAAEDAKMKAKGYTHRLNAWVHPPHGDDYMLVGYSRGAMSTAEVRAMLQRRRSSVLTDWKQAAL